MAESGEKIAKDAIDPELVKLKRKPLKVGPITCAGIVFLSLLFLWRINPDRKFAGSGTTADKVAVADIVSGKVGTEKYVAIDASTEPLISHAIRTTTAKGSLGLRVVPVRGTGDKLWLVVNGDGWSEPEVGAYVGRLRELSELPFAGAANDYLAKHPVAMFAAASGVRGAFATGKITAVTGEEITLRDGDRVAFEVTDPDAVIVTCTFNKIDVKDAAACQTAITEAGITVSGAPHITDEVARFDVKAPGIARSARATLDAHKLWGALVEPVTQHYETTWGALKGSSPAGFVIKGETIPDAKIDLVGFYVERGIPSGAYALITGETPDQYWYVLPVTIVVALIALLFAWALVRAVRRDLFDRPSPVGTGDALTD